VSRSFHQDVDVVEGAASRNVLHDERSESDVEGGEEADVGIQEVNEGIMKIVERIDRSDVGEIRLDRIKNCGRGPPYREAAVRTSRSMRRLGCHSDEFQEEREHYTEEEPKKHVRTCVAAPLVYPACRRTSGTCEVCIVG